MNSHSSGIVQMSIDLERAPRCLIYVLAEGRVSVLVLGK